MKDRLPIVIVAVAAVLVLGIVVRMRLGLAPAPPPPPPPAEIAQRSAGDAAPKGDYSARVQDRLKMLRAEHERRQRAEDTERADDTADARPEARQSGGQVVQGAADGQPASPRRGSALEFHVPNAPVGESFGELKHTLTSHPSREKRVEAAHEIGASEEPDAVTALMEAMNDRDPEVRVAGLEALGDYIEELTFEMLQPMLKDENPNVRFEALTLVGIMEPPEAMDAVTALGEDPDPDVRDLAAEVRHVLETHPTPFPVVIPPVWHGPRSRHNHPQ